MNLIGFIEKILKGLEQNRERVQNKGFLRGSILRYKGLRVNKINARHQDNEGKGVSCSFPGPFFQAFQDRSGYGLGEQLVPFGVEMHVVLDVEGHG